MTNVDGDKHSVGGASSSGAPVSMPTECASNGGDGATQGVGAGVKARAARDFIAKEQVNTQQPRTENPNG